MNNFPAMPVLTQEQQKIITDTCNVMVNRADSSEHSQNLRVVAQIALAALNAPPAPVLKPIELPKKYVCDKNGCDDDLLPSWQVMISCDEIIAAIRAAGYEVKE